MGRPMVRDAAHEAADRGRPKIAAPHHEAERDRVYIKLTGVRVSESESSVRATLNLNGNDGRSLPLYRPLCGRKLLHRDCTLGPRTKDCSTQYRSFRWVHGEAPSRSAGFLPMVR